MSSIAVMNWRNRTKEKLVIYKGGACSICGYNKPIWNVYDFHHRDPSKKDFSISGKSWSFDRLKQEVDKCDLLCRNCHSEVHWKLQQEVRQERMKINRICEKLEDIECEVCQKIFHPDSKLTKFCSGVCAKFARRKVVRPSIEQLKEDIDNLTWVAIGKKYGVSDNAIKKWARSYKILL